MCGAQALVLDLHVMSWVSVGRWSAARRAAAAPRVTLLWRVCQKRHDDEAMKRGFASPLGPLGFGDRATPDGSRFAASST
jgi:hypothetical protein